MRTALLIFLALALIASASELGKLQDSFMARYDETNKERDDGLKKLESSYVTALERHLDKVKASGKLERVIPVRDEIQAVQKDAAALPELPQSADRELKSMRDKFVDARGKILESHAKSLVDLADKMNELLKKKEADLTRQGKIDDALAAKRMRETLRKDVGIQAVRDLLRFAGNGGASPVALRLRRSGDNLEVLVRYDSRGKISMDSPVENVREQTGEGGELGDTTAKVLGEFVGAEGYDVDPWVAYHQVFKDPTVEGLTAKGMEMKPAAVVGESKGLRLTLKADEKSRHAHFGDVLPPKTAAGKFRISCRYYVPRENQSIAGFKLLQAVGMPIASHLFDQQGRWVEDIIEAESMNSGTRLIMYLTGADGNACKGAVGNDYIVLGELKIEHTAFAALVHTRFGNGVLEEQVFDEATSQPPFVLNGEIVGK